METTQMNILATSRTRWEDAWQIAIKWGRKNLKTLKQTTIEQASKAVKTIKSGQNQKKNNPLSRSLKSLSSTQSKKRQGSNCQLSWSEIATCIPYYQKQNGNESRNPISHHELNDREQGNVIILAKTIERLLGALKQTFPSATTFFQLINYDRKLPTHFKENLDFLNQILREKTQYIPLLPTKSFKTVEDNIHWTGGNGRGHGRPLVNISEIEENKTTKN